MACRSCRGRRAKKIQVTPTPKVVVPPPKFPPKRAIPLKRTTKFCSCGWMMAKSRYVDVRTNQWVEKYSCANHKCSNYNK